MNDLLTDPLITWRDSKGHRTTGTLPGAVAALAGGALADFPHLRPHQFEPWCMFLTQLAAISLHRSNGDHPNATEGEWKDRLLALTDGSHEPWSLIVDDLTKPAFFQPPVPEGAVGIAAWKESIHPDDSDMLVTAKGHDVKQGLIASSEPELWIFAITTLQTAQGYSGGAGGYNGIARMKGGYGNRPRIGYSADLTLTTRFLRDVSVILEGWKDLLERGLSEDGAALTWLIPWDGTGSLELEGLSPHFIEICRRVRLVSTPFGFACRYTTSRGRRCATIADRGDVGDPWIPIKRDDGGALTVGSRGFHYELLTQFLFEGDFSPALAQIIRSGDSANGFILASAMARGQGKTEGLHVRVLPVSAPVRRQLGRQEDRTALGRRARANVQRARTMRANVLYPALKVLAGGGTVPSDAFDDIVDETFFDELFAHLDYSDDEAQMAWDRRLYRFAWIELQRGVDRHGLESSRHYRRTADAESLFWACLNRRFPTLSQAIREDNAREERSNAD